MFSNSKGVNNMTHSMTNAEKESMLKEVSDLTKMDVLQYEDMIEILKITNKACQRVLASIDDPRPASKSSIS